MSRFSTHLRTLALGGISCFTLTLVASPAHAGWGWSNRWNPWWMPGSMQCKMWGGPCTKKSPERGKCSRDRHCRDHDASTKDWCFEGTCKHTARDQDACRPEPAGWCYRDHHCADHDANTVDWCFNMRCHHATRSTGACLAKEDKMPDTGHCCTDDRDCKDGDKSTLDWCNEGQCEHKERDDQDCKEPGSEYCCRDFQCDDGNAQTVDWCFDSACHHAPKNGDSCQPTPTCDPETCPQSDNPCTFAVCVQDSCGFDNRPEGTRCDEGKTCNSSGECVPQENTEPECESAEDCSDDNICNGEERCLEGACRPGTPADVGTPCGDKPDFACDGTGECVLG